MQYTIPGAHRDTGLLRIEAINLSLYIIIQDKIGMVDLLYSTQVMRCVVFIQIIIWMGWDHSCRLPPWVALQVPGNVPTKAFQY